MGGGSGETSRTYKLVNSAKHNSFAILDEVATRIGISSIGDVSLDQDLIVGAGGGRARTAKVQSSDNAVTLSVGTTGGASAALFALTGTDVADATITSGAAASPPKRAAMPCVASSRKTTEEEMVIWRTHDMTYKLAKGYSKQVRSKWTRIRDNPAYEQYQKEDIETHF